MKLDIQLNSFKIRIVIAMIVIGVVLGIVGSMDHDDAEQRQELYCSMVQTFEETNGQYGWPDFNGNAAEVCNE